MTSFHLRAAIVAHPFHPFSIHMADGRKIVITAPELIAHRADGETFVVVGPREEVEIFDLALAVSIELLPLTAYFEG
jgi:hypothetical protein